MPSWKNQDGVAEETTPYRKNSFRERLLPPWLTILNMQNPRKPQRSHSKDELAKVLLKDFQTLNNNLRAGIEVAQKRR